MNRNNVNHQSIFTKKLLGLAQRFNTWEVWSDFITIFAIAISNGLDTANREAREATYRKIIGKYNEAERDVFPSLAAEVITAMEEDPEQDFLGKAYMELELGNHWIGQFFTPYCVCQCMANISTDSVVQKIEQQGYITLNDCACGAGATLIAGVHSIKHALEDAKSPLNWQNHVLVTAQDIDYITGMMCYIQLSLLGCAGYVKVGNTITDPMREGDDASKYWFTPMYFSDVWRYRRIFANMGSLFSSKRAVSDTDDTGEGEPCRMAM